MAHREACPKHRAAPLPGRAGATPKHHLGVQVRTRIPQQFIDDLMARVDVVEVIERRVPLRKAGRNYVACCPFHHEKTPSFTVSPDKQFYHCFGCGAHGSAVGFLMAYDHMGFVEAVEELARDVGMPLPRESIDEAERPEAALYPLLARAAAFFAASLAHSPKARAYVRSRGLEDATLDEFGIGYAPPGWDSLLRALGQSPEVRAQMARAGLLVEKEGGGHYDRFRDRLMFPIHDARGRVIAFGGRVLGTDTPKYLNSPETAVFHKGKCLYGLHQLRKANARPARILVVEGYMDVVGLAQHGIRYAVATLGTSTTTDHVKQLIRVAPEVQFCFDGDAAGRQAAWRALESALPLVREGHQLGFLFLPEGEDPDSLVRAEGRAAFEARLATAVPLSSLLFDTLKAQIDLGSLDGRARLAELARPLLSKIPAGLFRQMMLEKLAELALIDASTLARTVEGAPAEPTRPSRASEPAGISPVRLAIALLLNRPGLAQLCPDTRGLRELELPGSGLLAQVLDLLHQNPQLNAGALIEHWRDRPEAQHLEKLAQWSLIVPADGMEAEFRGALERIRWLGADKRAEELLGKARSGGLTAEEKLELRALLESRSRACQGDGPLH
jgi:DNA primase